MKAGTSHAAAELAGPSTATATSTEQDEQASLDEQTSLGREILSGLLGMGIAGACVLPPLVHLVTGPLGPFIGGFVAANRARPGGRGRVIIAVMIGTGLAGVLLAGAKIFAALVGRAELPRWFPSTGTLMAIVGVAWMYGMAMATAGTAVSGALARRGTGRGESRAREP